MRSLCTLALLCALGCQSGPPTPSADPAVPTITGPIVFVGVHAPADADPAAVEALDDACRWKLAHAGLQLVRPHSGLDPRLLLDLEAVVLTPSEVELRGRLLEYPTGRLVTLSYTRSALDKPGIPFIVDEGARAFAESTRGWGVLDADGPRLAVLSSEISADAVAAAPALDALHGQLGCMVEARLLLTRKKAVLAPRDVRARLMESLDEGDLGQLMGPAVGVRVSLAANTENPGGVVVTWQEVDLSDGRLVFTARRPLDRDPDEEAVDRALAELAAASARR